MSDEVYQSVRMCKFLYNKCPGFYSNWYGNIMTPCNYDRPRNSHTCVYGVYYWQCGNLSNLTASNVHYSPFVSNLTSKQDINVKILNLEMVHRQWIGRLNFYVPFHCLFDRYVDIRKYLFRKKQYLKFAFLTKVNICFIYTSLSI